MVAKITNPSAVSNENNPKLAVVRRQDDLQVDADAIGTELIDECALAARLGVSRSTLQSWRYTGQGPRWIKLGRLVRYRSADVDAYLRAQTRGRVA